jgi:RecA-family ATPase
MADTPDEFDFSQNRKFSEFNRSNDQNARTLDWATLATQVAPERQWLIDHWIGFEPTLLAGRGGVGKSLLAQQIGTALSMGVHFIDAITKPVKVLMWACEDDHNELWRRQLSICRSFKSKLEELHDKFILVSRRGYENTLYSIRYGEGCWSVSYAILKEQIRLHKPQFVILDNVAHLFGGNENDRGQVTQFINGLAGLTTEPFGLLILAHPGKAVTSEFSGSTAWENCCRNRLFLSDRKPDEPAAEESSDAHSEVRYLAKRKSNYTVRDLREFHYEDGAFQSERITFSAVDAPGPFRDRRAERIVLDAVRTLNQKNIYGSESVGRNFLPKLIIEYKLAETMTKYEIDAAMRRLILSSKLKKTEIGKQPNRSDPRFGLQIAEDKCE